MDTLTEEPDTPESDKDTQEAEESEETANGDTSEDGDQEDAATKKRLADKDRYIKELESKAKTDTRSEEIKDLEWRLANKDRIDLVKDEYDKILDEGYEGEKVSNKIALELAEKRAKVDSSEEKRGRQDDMSVPSITTRNVNPKGYDDETDKMLGLTREKKRKLEERHPHLKAA